MEILKWFSNIKYFLIKKKQHPIFDDEKKVGIDLKCSQKCVLEDKLITVS